MPTLLLCGFDKQPRNIDMLARNFGLGFRLPCPKQHILPEQALSIVTTHNLLFFGSYRFTHALA